MIKTVIANAEKLALWIRDRGGIAVWSINLSNLGKEIFTPALTEEGQPYEQPSWEVDKKPAEIITDPTQVILQTPKEVKRFRVYTRMGSGLTVKCTDASTAKIRKSVAEAGEGSWYEFDYDRQQCVIYAPDKEITLADYLKQKEKE